MKVDMHANAFMVIGAIADFANARVRVAGAIVEVKSNLEAAAKDPDTMAQGLANACETAVRFRVACGAFSSAWATSKIKSWASPMPPRSCGRSSAISSTAC